MNFSEELAWRGFKNQTTLSSDTELDKNNFVFYFGVDPSADSMQVGNLASMMMVKHFIKHGHKAILLVGGATGMIGDPGGKNEERNLQPIEVINKNKLSIVEQYKQVLGELSFQTVDNYDWYKNMSVLEYLRDIGKHFSMTQLLDRDYISTRIGEGGSGISYAEFSYTILQGYDFLYLHRKFNVSLQLCGSDQWGNCVSGVDLIRKVTGKQTHIWSCPLITNKQTGKKFGKSEGGAIWLSEAKTSVYAFYQFWLNTDDESVGDYLKIFTMINPDEFNQLMDEFNNNRSSRSAQKFLAFEVTKTVHGKERAEKVSRISDVIFGQGSYSDLNNDDFEILKSEIKSITINPEISLEDILVKSELAESKSQARNFIQSNAIYLNGLKINDQSIQQSDLIHGFAVLRRGKNTLALVEFE